MPPAEAPSPAAPRSPAAFIGALLSLTLLAEPLTLWLVSVGGLMALGLWLHLTERHKHEHAHEANGARAPAYT